MMNNMFYNNNVDDEYDHDGGAYDDESDSFKM